MLVVDALSKRFGSVVALDDVSFTVEPGQIVGFLGPNGAGKTTTMRAIMGLIALDAGRVTWQDRTIDRDTRQRFGYMPAERGMYQRMSVRDHLIYYARLAGRDATVAAGSADEWLERLGLTERAGDGVQTLSSGNQQRVQLALALLNDPELLVLDEPFSGLDPIAVDTLGTILREQVTRGVALLLSSHQLDLVADMCTAVVIVDRGRVALRGDVAELRGASSTRYLDLEFGTPTDWQPSAPVVGEERGRRYRVTLDADADARPLLADAEAQGEVLGYSFAPPDLSEVFLGAVGRTSLDEAEPEENADEVEGRSVGATR